MIKSAEKEFVFEYGTVTPSCHASTVLPLDNGEVIVAWFGGKHEKNPDVEIYVSVRSTEGVWSTPVVVSDNDKIAHWNPVLYKRQNGEIILYFKYGAEIPTWITKYVISKDNGRTWSEPKELVAGDIGGRGPVKDKCLLLSNGTLLAPASTEGGKWLCFIDRSEDDGITWERTDYFPQPKYRGVNVGLIQPTLWESAPGTVHCFMRSDAGAIYRSDSEDYGKTWKKPKRTRLPNNNSGIDCARDDKGRLWLLYNPVDVNWGVRYPLLLSCSENNGKSFEPILNCEPGFKCAPSMTENGKKISKQARGEFSYPAIVYDNNKLFISYTYNRKQIVFWKIELE